jgi:hypothetical protein
MITMVSFITAFIIMSMIIAGGIGLNMALYSHRLKKYNVQVRQPKQPHLHDIIFARYN